MNDSGLNILHDRDVSRRVSKVTRRVLEQRASQVAVPRLFSPELYVVLQQVVHVLLPQNTMGTNVDIAAAIDARLADDRGSGWRFADLPADREAYVRGLTVLAEKLPLLEESVLAAVRGEWDASEGFALSRWMLLLKSDVVKAWLSHPAAMERIGYYGFADGATGLTDGPTAVEGWDAITPGTGMSFERGEIGGAA